MLSSGNAEQDEALLQSFNNVIQSRQPVRIPFMRFDVPRAVNGSLGDQSYKSATRYWAGMSTPVHELGIHYGQGYGIHRPAPL